MNDTIVHWILLALAAMIFPVAYALVLRRMNRAAIPRPPRLAFFFLFGTLGGWALAFLLSPSGLAASCMLLLIIAAPIALMVLSILLATRPERTCFHRFAMWAGFVFVLLPPLGMYAGLFVMALTGSLHD
ncbi:hypothetical protein [Haloferula sp. BvORR071]|uniref:hypothetical protein n=1 Tax=Haloferula sp. BvORR071 TaxID=1396141 RepID=UPI000555A557|nr:hypothetical protein [Haloferula sp. BvORR071]